ncbi:MAG: ATP-binding protein [Lachnospiraceae bacterium]|nr:ATP-binding protein [Lachnospiraceae bacterium]
MLISYKFKNFCSFAEEAEFDLLAPRNKVKSRFPDNYVETETGYDILKTAVLIGENAGGKSNFINSLFFLKGLFENNKTVHAYKNLININHLGTPSDEKRCTLQEFAIQVVADTGAVYHYNLYIDEYCIVREELSYRNDKNGREKVILFLERESLDVKNVENRITVSVNYNICVKNSKREIEELFAQPTFTKENVGLFITKLAILGDEHAKEFVNWMNDRLIAESQSNDYSLYREWQNVEEDIRIIQDPRFLDILRMVDYSICDIEIDEEKPFRNSRIIRKTKDGKSFSRELKGDSGGVREFFAWAVQLFRVVYEDKIVFADEMDRVINPILAERMIAFINGKKHRGQFIFSSHNVLHLDLKNYMKEQIYFVTKNRDNLNSELYSLADFPDVRYETAKIYEFYMKGILGGTAFE